MPTIDAHALPRFIFCGTERKSRMARACFNPPFAGLVAFAE
jgi:hypothetical protein